MVGEKRISRVSMQRHVRLWVRAGNDLSALTRERLPRVRDSSFSLSLFLSFFLLLPLSFSRRLTLSISLSQSLFLMTSYFFLLPTTTPRYIFCSNNPLLSVVTLTPPSSSPPSAISLWRLFEFFLSFIHLFFCFLLYTLFLRFFLLHVNLPRPSLSVSFVPTTLGSWSLPFLLILSRSLLVYLPLASVPCEPRVWGHVCVLLLARICFLFFCFCLLFSSGFSTFFFFIFKSIVRWTLINKNHESFKISGYSTRTWDFTNIQEFTFTSGWCCFFFNSLRNECLRYRVTRRQLWKLDRSSRILDRLIVISVNYSDMQFLLEYAKFNCDIFVDSHFSRGKF